MKQKLQLPGDFDVDLNHCYHFYTYNHCYQTQFYVNILYTVFLRLMVSTKITST